MFFSYKAVLPIASYSASLVLVGVECNSLHKVTTLLVECVVMLTLVVNNTVAEKGHSKLSKAFHFQI